MTDARHGLGSSQGEEEVLERDDAVIGQALRWSLVVMCLAGLIVGGVWAWIQFRPKPTNVTVIKSGGAQTREKTPTVLVTVPFKEITQSAGIDFVHVNGAEGEKLLPETMGGGCAFLDFDSDGDQDLLLVNSCNWPVNARDDGSPPTSALYRNDGHGEFTDVSATCGLAITCYGMGVAVGDYDNDGWVDVFITAVGLNHLFHNVEGKFVEVSQEAGVSGIPEQWSTSCAFVDYDNDRDLDLFVCNYVRWSREIDISLQCTLTGRGRAYCRPDVFQGAFPYLYRNDGAGKFTDVSRDAGIQATNPVTGNPLSKGLGLAPVDVDGDGLLDLIVADDTVQNLLFHNLGRGRFEEIGASRGIGFDTNGGARGAMGTDSAWFRNNDDLGVGFGNFANEQSALYVTHAHEMQFSDDANATGLGPPSKTRLKFGFFFFDYNLDGWQDVLTANGHIEPEISLIQESQQYEQPAHLFCNCGPQAPSEFALVPEGKSGADFDRPLVGRGATFADIDGDGDLDVLLTGIASAPRLLRNDQQLGNHWLRLKLVGTKCNRDAIGARVEVQTHGLTQYRQVMPTRSYLSQSELTLTFGLGVAPKVERVTIHWPDGTRQELQDVPLDKEIRVEQSSDAKAGRKSSR